MAAKLPSGRRRLARLGRSGKRLVCRRCRGGREEAPTEVARNHLTLIFLIVSADVVPALPFRGRRCRPMSTEQSRLADVTAAAREVLLLVNATPPHVRQWLRGIEAEAEHITVEVTVASE